MFLSLSHASFPASARELTVSQPNTLTQHRTTTAPPTRSPHSIHHSPSTASYHCSLPLAPPLSQPQRWRNTRPCSTGTSDTRGQRRRSIQERRSLALSYRCVARPRSCAHMLSCSRFIRWRALCSAAVCCREPDPFEWYQEFGALKHILSRYIQKQTVALVVGCGTSLVPEEIAAAGAKSVLAIDFAQTAIDIQKKRHANQQGLQCECT